METNAWIEQLSQQAAMIRSLCQAVSEEQARWRPNAGSWSMLEVINHLYDEEREDFRAHLEHILERPAEPWPRIDPQGWVTSRAYNQRDFPQSLENFLGERERSLKWLRGLGEIDRQAEAAAPFGAILAGDMLASWAAHDLLHLRQMIELHYAFTVLRAEPFSINYAGDW